MNEQVNRYARLRYTATGALAALAVAGAIAGTVALAAAPAAKTPGRPAAADGATKTATAPVPVKTQAPQPGSDRPFLNDVQQLVGDGTISPAEGRVLDGEIQAGRVDTDTLVSSGFTPTQLDAVQRALSSTKRGLAASLHRTSK